MTDRDQLFLSYSRNDLQAAAMLRRQLEQHGLAVFKDDQSIREGDLWLDRLQQAVDACQSFVLLVGRDGVSRWIGAETQVALSRHFGPHDDAKRLPIFPILLGDTKPETLPAFLRLFQATTWNSTDPLPERLIEQIREQKSASNEIHFKGCPFVGLDAFRLDQDQLFFGRQKETLDALSCFDTRRGFPTVRWLEINGNSGSGKSSLMNAGLLPLVDQGWLWPRTSFEHWRRIGPMMPGERPVVMLAEHLARTFGAEMAEVRRRLETDGDHALADWLRGRKPDDQTAFLLAIDQFEELFTFADPAERQRFDRLLAAALADNDCPLFVISTVRADFLDRFEVLPRLVDVQNRAGRKWTLPPIGEDGLREVIGGPARLAHLDVSEVQAAMVAEACDEPGALPLVENALQWLWEKREDKRLSGRMFTDQGGLAGILSHSADDLLNSLGERREQAMELLFGLVRLDPEGRRHTRQRLPLAEAVKLAGGGTNGHALVDRLAGRRTLHGGGGHGPLRLVTIRDTAKGETAASGHRSWVDLIHETLIRSKGLDADGKPQPYWPTLWGYIEENKNRAVWREQLKADTDNWLHHQKHPSYLWSHERVRELVQAWRQPGQEIVLSPEEAAFLGPIDPTAMLAELERPETSHKRRALIGERLDALGDPRQGVGVDAGGTPEIAWCPIKGGRIGIQLRKDPADPNSKVVDTRTREVAPFQIARYLVTVAQYRAFLEAADGWRDPRWWGGDDLYRDPEGDSYDVGRFGNHPALYVSWFDALAFCRWLSERMRTPVRLPDEWQWQCAATGGNPANGFPWGPDWDPKQEPFRANTWEGRLAVATAVGMYPAGASPSGVLDLAGSVWEWCLNKFDRPRVTKSRKDDVDHRALRGGSWAYERDFVRPSHRDTFDPTYRDNSVGFRVLCSSPIR